MDKSAPAVWVKPSDINVLRKTIGEAFTHKERSDFVDSFDRNEQHSACNVCWQDPLNKFNTRVKFLAQTK